MMFRETPGWAGNSTANRLEILSPASSSGCALARVQSPSCICHISLAAWGLSLPPPASHRGSPGWGDLGTRSERGRQGPEKEQVAGMQGEELFSIPGWVFTGTPPTCKTQSLPRAGLGPQVTPMSHVNRPPHRRGCVSSTVPLCGAPEVAAPTLLRHFWKCSPEPTPESLNQRCWAGPGHLHSTSPQQLHMGGCWGVRSRESSHTVTASLVTV